MQQQRCILFLGSAGYLCGTIMAYLQARGHVVPSHRSQARFAGSQRYDFWTDDIHSLVEQRIDTVVIAANMAAAHSIYDHAFFKQRVELLVRGCRQCRVIYISSDGIFDGKQGHYTESDIPVPMTPYGRNLQYFEETVQRLCANYCIIRPSYLYGYSLAHLDPRLTRVREQLLAGEQLAFFDDMIKSPMDVNQVAEAIAFLTFSEHIGIVHVAGEALSVYDFYREAMSSLGVVSGRLSAIKMPLDFPHPRDTSLDISLMQRLTGIEPLPVCQVLQRQNKM